MAISRKKASPLNILLLGAPGTGKTTHAHFLSERLNLPQISTSHLLKKARVVKAGLYFPDEVVIGLILSELLDEKYRNGFLLDGFPRTANQAATFCERFTKHCHVFILKASKTLLIERILARRICAKCERIYIELNAAHPSGRLCDDCGVPLIKRDDDELSTIEQRIACESSESDHIAKILETKHSVHLIQSDESLAAISGMLETIIRGI